MAADDGPEATRRRDRDRGRGRLSPLSPWSTPIAIPTRPWAAATRPRWCSRPLPSPPPGPPVSRSVCAPEPRRRGGFSPPRQWGCAPARCLSPRAAVGSCSLWRSRRRDGPSPGRLRRSGPPRRPRSPARRGRRSRGARGDVPAARPAPRRAPRPAQERMLHLPRQSAPRARRRGASRFAGESRAVGERCGVRLLAALAAVRAAGRPALRRSMLGPVAVGGALSPRPERCCSRTMRYCGSGRSMGRRRHCGWCSARCWRSPA